MGEVDFRAFADEHGNPLEWSLDEVAFAPAEHCAGRGVLPVRTRRQIDMTRARTELRNRSDEHVRSEEKLVLDLPGALVVRVVEPDRPHGGWAGLCGDLHLRQDVRRELLAQLK